MRARRRKQITLLIVTDDSCRFSCACGILIGSVVHCNKFGVVFVFFRDTFCGIVSAPVSLGGLKIVCCINFLSEMF